MGKALAAWLMVASSALGSAAPRQTVQTESMRLIAVIEEARVNRPEAGEGIGRVPVTPPRDEIRRVAGRLFDFDEMARRILSRHWAARTPDERRELAAVVADLLDQSYGVRLAAYAGEPIVFGGETIDGDYATVRSRIIHAPRVETAVDYRLHRQNGRWRVYDVLVDGVSFVSTHRTDLSRALPATSYRRLLDRLRGRGAEVTAARR